MVGILSSFAVSVVAGLASSAVESGVGYVLHQITSGGEPSEIEKIGVELNAIERAVQGLYGELAKDTEKILAELKEVKQEQLYIAWQNRDQDLQKYITQINVQYQRFLSYAAQPETTSQEEVDQLVKEILNTDNGAEVSMAQISTLISGSGQNKGVLELYTDMTTILVSDNLIFVKDALNSYFEYYIAAASAQQRALYLLIEAYHQQGNSALAEAQLPAYHALVKKQEIPFVSNVDVFLRAAIKHGYPAQAPLQFVQANQDYYAQNAYISAYEPTACRAKAERIYNNALCMKPGETRIVVTMVYPYYDPKRLNIEHIDVPIVPVSQLKSAGILPSYETTFKADNKPAVKRMVYENVPGGSYVMKDLNGTEGLNPRAGSSTRTIYFQQPKYLPHQMIVNDTAKGAFMDFCPYRSRHSFV